MSVTWRMTEACSIRRRCSKLVIAVQFAVACELVVPCRAKHIDEGRTAAADSTVLVQQRASVLHSSLQLGSLLPAAPTGQLSLSRRPRVSFTYREIRSEMRHLYTEPPSSNFGAATAAMAAMSERIRPCAPATTSWSSSPDTNTGSSSSHDQRPPALCADARQAAEVAVGDSTGEEGTLATQGDATVYLGMCASTMCSYHFGQGRSEGEIRASELTGMNISAEVDAGTSSKRVTCHWGEGQWRSTFRYVGEHLGCLHESHTAYNVPLMNWGKFALGLVAGRPTAMSSGFATYVERAIVALPSSSSQQTTPSGGHSLADATVTHAFKVFVDHAIAHGESYSVAVMYKGKLVAERYNSQHEISEHTRLRGNSMGKSLLSLVLGARLSERGLGLDTQAHCPEVSLENKLRRGLTLGNLINMRIGDPLREDGPEFGLMMYTEPDAAAFASRGSGMISPQSRSYYYSTGSFLLLSRELRFTFPGTISGLEEYVIYPWKAVFSRIGADSFQCEQDAAGTINWSFCMATARDWLKIGQLVLQRGRWGSEQVVPSAWVDLTTAPYPDSRPYYTHGWYRLDQLYGCRHPILGARGTGGQMLIIVPGLELVVARHGLLYGDVIDDDYGGRGRLEELLVAMDPTYRFGVFGAFENATSNLEPDATSSPESENDPYSFTPTWGDQEP